MHFSTEGALIIFLKRKLASLVLNYRVSYKIVLNWGGSNNKKDKGHFAILPAA